MNVVNHLHEVMARLDWKTAAKAIYARFNDKYSDSRRIYCLGSYLFSSIKIFEKCSVRHNIAAVHLHRQERGMLFVNWIYDV